VFTTPQDKSTQEEFLTPSNEAVNDTDLSKPVAVALSTKTNNTQGTPYYEDVVPEQGWAAALVFLMNIATFAAALVVAFVSVNFFTSCCVVEVVSVFLSAHNLSFKFMLEYHVVQQLQAMAMHASSFFGENMSTLCHSLSFMLEYPVVQQLLDMVAPFIDDLQALVTYILVAVTLQKFFLKLLICVFTVILAAFVFAAVKDDRVIFALCLHLPFVWGRRDFPKYSPAEL